MTVPPRDDNLLRQFDEAMLGIYHSAGKLKPPYYPSAFLRMVSDYGGKETADRLLSKKQPSQGFADLYIRGRENLRLSVEYLVLQEPWRKLFTPDQRQIARSRLLDAGFDPPPEDNEPLVEPLLAEELPPGTTHFEGASRQILVNAYERNSAARAQCIAHHGSRCSVCGFDFGGAYGPIAEGFIHVHHLKPLSEIQSEYQVDPIADLRPVCANCHAVIHLGGECRSISAVRQLLADSETGTTRQRHTSRR